MITPKRLTFMNYLLSPLLMLALGSLVKAQPPIPSRLEIGKTQQSEMSDGKPRRYQVNLQAGQYMRIGVSRPSFATVIRLFGPSEAAALLEFHWPAAPQVREPLSWIAGSSGRYTIEYAPGVQTGATGAYSITFEELRNSMADDPKQLALQELFEAARTLDERHEYQKAIAVWNQALVSSQTLSDREREAAVLNSLGSSFENLSQYEKAFGYFEKALILHGMIKDRRSEGNALRNMGNMSSSLSQFQKAAGYYQQGLVIAREVNDQNGEARALANLALSAANLGQYDKAIDLYKQGLPVIREVKDRIGEGRLLVNLGIAYRSSGRYELAIGYFEQGLAIAREAKDRRAEGLVLGNLGNAYFNLSYYEKAINYHTQALAIRREMRDRRDEAGTLASIGSAYRSLGQYEKSIANYKLALPVFQEVKSRLGESNALRNLGSAYGDSNRPDLSIPYYEQSLAISRDLADRRGEGRTFDLLGSAYQQLHQADKAIGYFEQALTASGFVKDRSGQGNALGNLGSVYASQGQYPKAISYFDQAIFIAREIKSRQLESINLSRLMDAWKLSGQTRLAALYGKLAVNVIQSIRSDIRGLTQDLQASFLKGNEDPYHKLADLLIAQGRLIEAEQVLGLLKEQEFFEFVRRDATESVSNKIGVALTQEEAEAAKAYNEVDGNLVALGIERGELLTKSKLTPEETQRLEKLDADLTAGSRNFGKFMDELSTRFNAKSAGAAKLDKLRDAQGFSGDLGEMPPGTVAIYMVMFEDKYRAILFTSQTQKAFEYPITAVELNRKVLEFREVIRNPKLDPRPRAQELYTILIGKMAEDLKQAKAKTLMFSLDGTLRYLPLAALYDGQRYLVEQYQLSVFTMASMARIKDRPTPQWKAAGFGVTKAFEGAPALPSVEAEMNGIILQNPGSEGVLKGEVRLDDQFTQDTLRSTLRKSYPVVHIASHFMFQPGNDASSFLLLGDGSHFSLAELKSLGNLFARVELLTLSACNTGVGDVPGEGKEVEGLGVVAQRQGAKAVIASLWPVADASTSLLMREFYRIRESAPGITKSDALAQAQLVLLRGTAMPRGGAGAERALIHEGDAKPMRATAPSFTAPENAPYAHPYYWAPFFLMGNWL